MICFGRLLLTEGGGCHTDAVEWLSGEMAIGCAEVGCQVAGENLEVLPFTSTSGPHRVLPLRFDLFESKSIGVGVKSVVLQRSREIKFSEIPWILASKCLKMETSSLRMVEHRRWTTEQLSRISLFKTWHKFRRRRTSPLPRNVVFTIKTAKMIQ